MRRFLIFFFSGIMIISFVFVYSQFIRGKIVADSNIKFSPKKGKILGTRAKKIENQQKSPIIIKIDKNPAYLYWQQKITVETTPNTEVRIKVAYVNGSINNSGTKTGLSDKNGKFTDSWIIKGNKDILGYALVEVSVGSLDTYSQSESGFEIIKYQSKSAPVSVLPAS